MDTDILLSKINFEKDKRHEYVDTLKSVSNNYIYGAGNYSERVSRFLNDNHVVIQNLCVDECYLSSSPGAMNICDVPRDANVIIAFADHVAARKNIDTLGFKNYFLFDSLAFGLDFMSYQYVSMNADRFVETLSFLEDEKSEKTFFSYINSRIIGQPCGSYPLITPDQYFTQEVFNIGESEVFVDCGAYTGDTISGFLKAANRSYEMVYGFEPDPRNYDALLLNTDIPRNKNIKLLNGGVWDESKDIYLNMDNDSDAKTTVSMSDGLPIKVYSIDDVVIGHHATFIKMDIEGSELRALQGARKTIFKSKPKLAICMYHRPEDLITIPQFIKNINPSYKFKLRQHLPLTQELVLYAY